MKNKFILGLLFVLPIATYLIFASAKHNALFLPMLFEYQQDMPQDWKTVSGESVQLKDKITILGFTGFDIEKNKETVRWNSLMAVLQVLNIKLEFKSPLTK